MLHAETVLAVHSDWMQRREIVDSIKAECAARGAHFRVYALGSRPLIRCRQIDRSPSADGGWIQTALFENQDGRRLTSSWDDSDADAAARSSGTRVLQPTDDSGVFIGYRGEEGSMP